MKHTTCSSDQGFHVVRGNRPPPEHGSGNNALATLCERKSYEQKLIVKTKGISLDNISILFTKPRGPLDVCVVCVRERAVRAQSADRTSTLSDRGRPRYPRELAIRILAANLASCWANLFFVRRFAAVERRRRSEGRKTRLHFAKT